MIHQFKTVLAYGASEIVIKKSRFIGHVKPIQSEEEAAAFIEMIKKEHTSAAHNCSAYVVGERDQIQKHSDDGEPSGTAGKPIMEVIKHQGLKNVAVVVTRYFGGILLGAGGLIRAYTDGAVAGIAAAVPIHKVLHRKIVVEVDYTWYGKLENEFRNHSLMLGETLFTDKVTVACFPLEADAEAFIQWMLDLTLGQCVLTAGESEYRNHKIV
ncbi:YigZ family protein [Paenibacillus sp. GP183]|uniref:YigZ family protein n=1 Tax=Paenibacillus sp. GP183 TaxID=1882751 RepID=UPI000899FD02|nr:YigZ family protein [Paenibacillus sp. GP183]SEC05490.1 uncharacterized protein, YigZ family [Paenibacillus sp. GP183]